jgi:hypothetical protein
VNHRLLACALLVLFATGLRAADDAFVIEVSAKPDGGQGVSSRSADAATRARMTIAAQPRRKLEIKWSVTAAAGSKPAANVTVHAFLERSAAVGTAASPKPGPNAPYESAVGVDFSAGSKATGQISFEVPDAGDYLLRVETIGAAATAGREQAAALDVKVTP